MSWGTSGISSEGHFLRQGREESQASLPALSVHAQKQVVQEARAGWVLGEVSPNLPRQPALGYPVQEEGGDEKRGRDRGLGN